MRALRYCFSFSGRFNRANFWIGYGIAFLMTMVPVIALEWTIPNDRGIVSGIVGVWCVAWFVSILAVATKRLHDLDRSGLLLLAFLITLAVLPLALRSQGSQVEGAIGSIGLIALGALPGMKGKNRFGPDPSEAAPETAAQDQQQNVREANRLLKEINKSLGFPEGQGPTGITVDGQYRVVNVGHTERMKNDPVYAFGNEMAEIMMEIKDLENAMTEAEASNQTALVRSITNELQVLERKANALMDKHQREHPPTNPERPR
jgi:uncharacterized membrane protein YhaH (DUF805 family)